MIQIFLLGMVRFTLIHTTDLVKFLNGELSNQVKSY